MSTRIAVVALASFLALPAVVSAQQAKKSTGSKKKAAVPPKPAAPTNWLLWGGSDRNFVTSWTGLADAWPPSGPKKLWSRPLGDGYSPIAVEDNRLYTGYRRGSSDVIVALDAATGKTIWEYAYENQFENSWNEVAPGPYSMPQVVGNRLITASGTGKIHSLDKQTGKPVWSHDLYREFGGTRLGFGYSCHALPYKDSVILLAGGRGSAVVAFDQGDGRVLWKANSFENAHSSPLLIQVDGQPQVVALGAREVISFSPDDGRLLWRHDHPTQHGLAVSTPVWMPGNLLFIASAYSSGSRMLELKQAGGKTTVKELWFKPRLQLHFGSAIFRDGHLYFSEGYNGPSLLTALEPRSGAVKWQQRAFSKAQLVYAEGKLVVLDQDGTLGLVRVNWQKYEELARLPNLLQSLAWTPPTLAGTRLFARDRKTIVALDLAK
jgi:outer membrane protein assembly factor BamB